MEYKGSSIVRGTITVEDQDYFTCGCCHLLAQEISRRAGWPLYSISDDDGLPDDHAFVLHPSGKYLDVNGLHSEEEMLEGWASRDDAQVIHTNWTELLSWGDDPDGFGWDGDKVLESIHRVAGELINEFPAVEAVAH